MGMRGEQDNPMDVTSSLSVIYEDPEVVVYTAPNEDELKAILLRLLKRYERMNIRELHSILSGLASEDKIRHALNELMKENKVIVDTQGYYYPAEYYEEDYLLEEYIEQYDGSEYPEY